ncbi:MAG: hypothetical protein H6500_07215 [Candidatus Woesearchaeota archaeon]|nr:hypothetical protein [Nanoarchaeota archaeon]USN44149.1 MAG: hypothetical protein H6500_07215 [Candidatus Woesearchaeota archaeon]
MDKERIHEAKVNVKRYLEDGLLQKYEFRKEIFETYLKNSEESLLTAQLLQETQTSNLWIIVSSYYSMFYIANAYLLKLGYKVGHKIAHKVTADSLIVLVKDKFKESYLLEFDIAVEEALSISENLVENFDSLAGYYTPQLCCDHPAGS